MLRRSLLAKVWLILGAFFALLLVIFAINYTIVRGQRGDGLAINVAGAQRMLTQKMAKEALAAVGGDEGARKALKETAERFDAVLNGLLKGGASLNTAWSEIPEVRRRLEAARDRWQPFRTRVEIIAGGQDGPRQREAAAYIAENDAALLQAANDVVVAMQAASEARIDAAVRLQAVLLSLSLAVLFAGWLLLGRWVLRPIKRLTLAASAVAGGDLEVPEIPVRSGDEIGRMTAAFNRMVANLREMVGRIGEDAERKREIAAEVQTSLIGVFGTAASLSDVSRDLGEAAGQTRDALGVLAGIIEHLREAALAVARGAQDQARNVAQTSEIISQVAQAIDQVAGQAQQVSDAAGRALAAAEDGGAAVQRTVEGMARIRDTALEAAGRVRELGERSRKIGEIVEMIGGIADQTNLLALNAAIEAARAGEHGKGFAVVAEEVRKLAERSGRAAQEIAELIGAIRTGVDSAVAAMDAGTREVEAGAELAGGVSRALDNILQAMRQTNGYAQNISAAAEEVAASAGEVVRAVDNVAAVTEENAAGAGEMEAGHREMEEALRNLEGAVRQMEQVAGRVDDAGNRLTGDLGRVAEEISRLTV